MDEVKQHIVFCPVCCSNVDVEGRDGQRVEVECGSCGQPWQMELDSDRITKHSMN